MDSTKTRADAWDATLTEVQRWQVYELTRRSNYPAVAQWIEKELKIDPPGKSAYYAWCNRMRENESAHRVEEAITARAEVGALAATSSSSATLIEAYKSMAADMALKGFSGEAVKYTDMAMALAAAQTKERELELKARAQETKDEALRLAREKFEAAEARLNSAKEVVTDTKLSDAERTQKIKQIFGLS